LDEFKNRTGKRMVQFENLTQNVSALSPSEYQTDPVFEWSLALLVISDLMVNYLKLFIR
jgi:hypothetical protein